MDSGGQMVGMYMVMYNHVQSAMGGLNPNDLFNDVRVHQGGTAAPDADVAAQAPKDAPAAAQATPLFSSGADSNSYNVVFSDGYMVSVINNGNYIKISIPPTPEMPIKGEYTLMYTTAMKMLANVGTAGSAHHNRAMDEFSAAGNWRTVGEGIDSRGDVKRGYVQQDVLHQSHLVPRP
jgi:hypothetical protein